MVNMTWSPLTINKRPSDAIYSVAEQQQAFVYLSLHGLGFSALSLLPGL